MVEDVLLSLLAHETVAALSQCIPMCTNFSD